MPDRRGRNSRGQIGRAVLLSIFVSWQRSVQSENDDIMFAPDRVISWMLQCLRLCANESTNRGTDWLVRTYRYPPTDRCRDGGRGNFCRCCCPNCRARRWTDIRPAGEYDGHSGVILFQHSHLCLPSFCKPNRLCGEKP